MTQRLSTQNSGGPKQQATTTPECQLRSEVKLLEMGIEPMTLGLLDPRSNQLSYTSFRIFLCRCGCAMEFTML